MRISNREMILAWLTVIAIILGLTYWKGTAQIQEWKEAVHAREALAGKEELPEYLAKQEANWLEKLTTFREQLPHHPVDKDVTAELMKTLELTARTHNLILIKREPQKEKPLDDLYELAIHCSWEGTLDSLVHFLYAIQVQGATLDIRNLQITPQRGGNKLKGTFTVDCAYCRGAEQSPGNDAPSDQNTTGI